MARPDPNAVKRVAIVGAGLIGSAWATNCLARGIEVRATDPHPEGAAKMRAAIDNAWPAMQRLGLAPGADPNRVSFHSDLAETLEGAAFVQESAPDREDVKTALLARIDAIAGPEVVIASSSSGLLPTDIQAQCRHPERVLIGHPFNPVYLVPLVEVIPGKATAADAVDWAMAFYTALGKYALHVRSEKPGYIANRLQEAIWREAMALVAEGAATTQEIDASIAYGPGLRWALMGPCFTFHLAGGEGGMKQMLHHFDPTGRPSWTYAPLPDWTDALKQALIDGTAAQAQGRDFASIERIRNERLLTILEALGPGRLGVDA